MRTFVVHKFPWWGYDGPDEYYLLLMPDYNEPEFYRQTMSLNAFFYSAIQRNLNKHTGYCYTAEIKELWDKVRTFHKDVPKVKFVKTFSGIWKFYDYIGYNYKTKKFKKST